MSEKKRERQREFEKREKLRDWREREDGGESE